MPSWRGEHKPELAWTLADYVERGEEPPTRIEYQPDACEGELMSDDEIATYITDSVQALAILHDRQSKSFDPAKEAFWRDLEFLVTIGRLDEEDYNEIITLDYKL